MKGCQLGGWQVRQEMFMYGKYLHRVFFTNTNRKDFFIMEANK